LRLRRADGQAGIEMHRVLGSRASAAHPGTKAAQGPVLRLRRAAPNGVESTLHRLPEAHEALHSLRDYFSAKRDKG
jgi:hypothetical protein